MSLDDRRKAALNALSNRPLPTGHYHGETQPSGSMPIDPFQIADPLEPDTEDLSTPRCPEALFNPDTGDLRQCVYRDRHQVHQTIYGTKWRLPEIQSDQEAPPW